VNRPHSGEQKKHFVVIKGIQPEPPALQFEFVELESVHCRRSTIMPWRNLTDVTKWRHSWK